MKNIIIGTAGHVDHGKTCLIKALTGTDCDRLKEEKKRGITIENGFADMMTDDYNISIIDVPGHEKFIRNMLMGIGGIDLVLLVVGLDEGVMPQTREHFEILNVLGIRRGIMVFTKRDLVDDEEWIEMVKEDARDMAAGSFMEGCDEIEVSAYDGYNIDKLKELIVSNIDDTIIKSSEAGSFRLPADRVFTIDGFGTVLTGTLLEGKVKKGDEIMLYPEKKTAKVRSVQVHNETVDEAYAGQRTAINIQGVKKEDLERGVVLATPGSMETTMMIDLRLELFKDAERSVMNGSRVHFYCGASDVLAKVVLLDREVLEPGEKCYCQFRLEEEIAVKKDDMFVIRFFSPVLTIGGGKILEVTPRKHKRFDEEVLKEMEIKDKGENPAILEQIIRESSFNLQDVKSLASKMRISKEEAERIIKKLLEEKKIRTVKRDFFIHSEYIKTVRNRAEEMLRAYHAENSMSGGLMKEEFKSRLLVSLKRDDKRLGDDFTDILIEDGVIKSEGNLIAMSGFTVRESPETEKMKRRILSKYTEARFEMPEVENVISGEKDKANARHIIDRLEEEGKLVRLNYQYYIDAEAYEWALSELKKIIQTNGRITLAEFRDLIGTSRKYAIEILDYMDGMKITQKIEDYRILVV